VTWVGNNTVRSHTFTDVLEVQLPPPSSELTPPWRARDRTRASCTETLKTTHKTTRCHCLGYYSRVLPEKLRVPQSVTKFPAFHGTQMFTAVFITARNLSLSSAWSFQSTSSHYITWRFILILSFHLRSDLASCLFILACPPPKSCTHFFPIPYVPHSPPISLFLI